MDARARQGLLEAASGVVVADLADEGAVRPETRRDGGAVCAASSDCFADAVDGSFAIGEEIVAGRNERGLDVAVDVADDAQLRFAQERFVEHNRTTARVGPPAADGPWFRGGRATPRAPAGRWHSYRSPRCGTLRSWLRA